MKIEKELIAAIRAACRQQPVVDRNVTCASRHKAAQDFLSKNPGMKAKLVKLVKLSTKLEKQLHAAQEKMRALEDPVGLSHRHNGKKLEFYVHTYGDDEDRFKKAGGVLPNEPPARWKADEVISLLAQKDVKERTAILKRYGINWT